MPLYRYECSKCASVEEVFLQWKNYTEDRECPVCGGKAHRNFAGVGLKTDTSFFAGVGTLLQQCDGDEKEANRIAKAAKKEGYTPSYNDFYCPTVGDSPASSFIPVTGGREHVKKVCRRRGVSCRGMVEMEAPERPPTPKKKLSEKFIRERSAALIHRDPGLANKKRELREQLIDTHAFRKE
ncbi:MAG: FmdB family zinc ribbon protein [Planctomycetota bacterium]|jgi:putative FmdB family regulatory protein